MEDRRHAKHLVSKYNIIDSLSWVNEPKGSSRVPRCVVLAKTVEAHPEIVAAASYQVPPYVKLIAVALWKPAEQ